MMWLVDLRLAYFQSNMTLIRKIIITNPAPELELYPGECLDLPKTIYGLADPGDKCHRALDARVHIDLKLIPLIIDPSLYCQFQDD